LPSIDPNPSPGQVVVAHDKQVIDGEQWKLNTFSNAAGDTCMQAVVPGEEGGLGTNCVAPDQLFAQGPIRANVGSRTSVIDRAHWSAVWIWGRVADNVARVTLTTNGCSGTPLSFDADGVFLHVIPASGAALGAIPHALVAYNAAGTVVGTQVIPVAATPSAQRAQASIPRPPACK
jgi:hypothetical protein